MKKINFLLKTDEIEEINSTVLYTQDESDIKFEYDKWEFLISINENNRYLKRKSDKDEFMLVQRGNLKRGKVNLIKENIETFIPLKSLTFDKIDNIIRIEYEIDGDYKKRIIVITFLD